MILLIVDHHETFYSLVAICNQLDQNSLNDKQTTNTVNGDGDTITSRRGYYYLGQFDKSNDIWMKKSIAINPIKESNQLLKLTEWCYSCVIAQGVMHPWIYDGESQLALPLIEQKLSSTLKLSSK